jgi:hypothetical protein
MGFVPTTIGYGNMMLTEETALLARFARAAGAG